MRIGVLIAIVAATACCGAADGSGLPATTWRNVAVETTDGAVHRDVTVYWTLAGFGLRLVAPDGTASTLGPLEVRAIRDRTGADITGEVAAANPATDVRFALIGARRTTPFRFGVMLEAGGTAGLTKGSGGFKPVPAAFAGVRLRLADRAHLALLYRRQQVTESVRGTFDDVSRPANEYHLLLGLRWRDPRDNNNYSYVEIGAAAVSFGRRYDGANLAWSDDGAVVAALTCRGGVVLPLGGNLGLDLGAQFMLRPTLVRGTGTAGLLGGLNLGLTYRTGR